MNQKSGETLSLEKDGSPDGFLLLSFCWFWICVKTISLSQKKQLENFVFLRLKICSPRSLKLALRTSTLGSGDDVILETSISFLLYSCPVFWGLKEAILHLLTKSNTLGVCVGGVMVLGEKGPAEVVTFVTLCFLSNKIYPILQVETLSLRGSKGFSPRQFNQIDLITNAMLLLSRNPSI